ncbi:MAG: TIGR03088 family PEP-CTERM/XrtA system glycosyltransferase [Caldimonas sp.]
MKANASTCLVDGADSRSSVPSRIVRKADVPPLVVHVVHRFDVGGLENGVVNLINHLPASAYRHAVIALTEATDFRLRIQRDDVEVVALHKPPGHAVRLYPRLFRLMRQWKPQIVHSRNLAALEALVPAWAAGVPVRIHGEHGRDVDDIDGTSRKYQWMRRLYKPVVDHYVALGSELGDYLIDKIDVAPSDVTQICNGVDTDRFACAGAAPALIDGCPFDGRRHWLVGTVGRMQTVKDQPTLARAFAAALRQQPQLRKRLRLVMVGDGPLRAESRAVLEREGVADLSWLPGERDDIPAVLRGLNCFVLPSLAEGVSNTILEAMASGLPVIATAVGANATLVQHDITGEIVPPRDADAIARGIVRLALRPDLAEAMGRAGRVLVEDRFSLTAMTAAYQRLYDSQLAARGITDRNEMGRG